MVLQVSLTSDQLTDYLATQLANFFPDGQAIDKVVAKAGIDGALERLEYCFRHIPRPNFVSNGQACFSHLHSDQYAMFLYMLANTLWQEQKDSRLATKVYYANKCLHGLDIYYEVQLPEIFLLRHPVGTVLGRAKYANFFTVGQNCTVGHDQDLFPEFGEGCALYAGATVVGNSHLGRNCHVSAHTFIRNQDVPDGAVAFGRSPDLHFKKARHGIFDDVMRFFIESPVSEEPAD